MEYSLYKAPPSSRRGVRNFNLLFRTDTRIGRSLDWNDVYRQFKDDFYSMLLMFSKGPAFFQGFAIQKEDGVYGVVSTEKIQFRGPGALCTNYLGWSEGKLVTPDRVDADGPPVKGLYLYSSGSNGHRSVPSAMVASLISNAAMELHLRSIKEMHAMYSVHCCTSVEDLAQALDIQVGDIAPV